MKEFKNLVEAIAYHRMCYVCGACLVHGLKIDLNSEGSSVFKWNTDDWIIIDAHTNQISYVEQVIRYDDDLIYSTPGLIDKIRRFYKSGMSGYDGIMYESIHVECGSCHQFSYTIQIIINVTANRLEGIFLNSEFISYEDEKGDLHEIKNNYAHGKTEYTHHVTPTPKYDGTIKRMSIPIISLNLQKPAETVERVRKLIVFS